MDKHIFARNLWITVFVVLIFGIVLLFCCLVLLCPRLTVGTFLTPPGVSVILFLLIGVFIASLLIGMAWKGPRGPPEK